MRVVLIDTSGGMSAAALEAVRADIRIGDFVLLFDHHTYPVGVMQDQTQIDTFQLRGGGGTLISPALDYIKTMGAAVSETVCYSDGYFDQREIALSGLKFELKLIGE